MLRSKTRTSVSFHEPIPDFATVMLGALTSPKASLISLPPESGSPGFPCNEWQEPHAPSPSAICCPRAMDAESPGRGGGGRSSDEHAPSARAMNTIRDRDRLFMGRDYTGASLLGKAGNRVLRSHLCLLAGETEAKATKNEKVPELAFQVRAPSPGDPEGAICS